MINQTIQEKPKVFFVSMQISSPEHCLNYLSNFAGDNGNVKIIVQFEVSLRRWFDKKLLRNLKNSGDELTVKFVPSVLSEFMLLCYTCFYFALGYKIVLLFKKKHICKNLRYLFLRVLLNVDFCFELEGDFKAELDYLDNHQSRYFDPNPQKDTVTKFQNSIELAQRIITVSNEYCLFLKRSYPHKIIISRSTGSNLSLQTTTPSNRAFHRTRLNLDGKLCGIFSGNVRYQWQNLTDTIRLINELYKLDSQYCLLVCVHRQDLSIAAQIKKDFDTHNVCKIVSENMEAMHTIYCASDFGILLRKNHLMNIRCCPGKIGDYLYSDLPMVITKYVGDFYNELKNTNFVYFVPNGKLEAHDFKVDADKINSWLKKALREDETNAQGKKDYSEIRARLAESDRQWISQILD